MSYSSGRFSSKYNHPVPIEKLCPKGGGQNDFPMFLSENEIHYCSLYPVT